MAVGSTKVVQVTNIAPQATKDQMHTLFGYLGKIEDIRLYPTIRDVSCPVQSRICYIKFTDSATVGIAQHMTNTVFIDRALIVIPISNGDIPDEYYALEMTKNGTVVPGLSVGEPKLPPHVQNISYGIGTTDQCILTRDPKLEKEELALYPPLPSTYDAAKIEETRRTVLLLNVDASSSNDEIIEFFSKAGEVKYLRQCKKESDDATHMLVEFTDQTSVVNALKLNGTELSGKPVEVQHATQPIVKPQAKSNEAAQKEIEEAMSRFKEAQNMINASIEPVIGMLTKDKRSSRRSRSRSRGRRRRSRSRSRSRRRSRSRKRRSLSSKRRSKSRDRKRRSKSRSSRRSTSRSKRSVSRRRSRSTSRSKRRTSHHRSRSRGKSRDRKISRERSRDRKRSRDRDRKSSRGRESKEKLRDKGRESKEKRSDKENSVDTEKGRKISRSRSRSHRRSRSRDRKKERKRSRSRGSRRRSPSPRKKRSRSRSRDRKRDKKDKDRKDRDKKGKDRRSRSRSRSSRSTRSHSKVPRNYDEEEKGYDKEKDKDKSYDKEKREKSYDKDRERSYDKEKPSSKEPESETSYDNQQSPEKSDNICDNMDISNSP